jgi:hypothetical protein
MTRGLELVVGKGLKGLRKKLHLTGNVRVIELQIAGPCQRL